MTLRELLNHNRADVENWIRARARTAYVGDAVLCRVLGSLNMYVDPMNYDMSPWLMLDGLWESWVGLAIGRAIQPGWTCIDAGAWCGYYSLLMADLAGPSGKLIAFEPNYKHHNLCQRSLKANGFSWGEVHGFAIGKQDGAGQFLLTDGGGSRLSSEGTETVPVFNIDGWGEPRIDLIKMDIEGGEYDAWQGMQQTIANNPSLILVMEWEPLRYPDARAFADTIAQTFALREITTDGVTANISKDDLLAPVMRNLWLQR